MNKWSIFLILLIKPLSGVNAQHLTSSPYSMYGLGQPEITASASSLAMGGIAAGQSSTKHINLSNPASLSSMDSLTFYFDLGVSARNYTYSLQNYTEKRNEGNFTHFAMGVKPTQWWGLSAGIAPYTTVGYNIKDYQYIEGSTALQEVHFEGTGGLTKLFVSNGFSLSRNLSVGFTAAYIFGNIYHNELQSNINIEQKSHTRSLRTEYAFLYQTYWLKNKALNIGLTYSPVKKTVLTHEQNVRDQTDNILLTENPANTTQYLPEQFCLALSTQLNEKWNWGMQFERQNWNKNTTGNASIKLADLNRFSMGTSWTPKPRNARKLMGASTYRLGWSIENSGYITSGINPMVYKVAAGIGFPTHRSSSINVALSYQNDNANNKALSTEVWQLSVGFSLLENWFEKPKFR